MKFCKRCKTETDRSARGQCKPCAIVRVNIWVNSNREKSAAKNAAWYIANKDKLKEKNAVNYADNKESFRVRHAAYYVANKTKVMARVDAYRVANIDKCKAASAKWRAANYNKKKISDAAWQKANPESCRIRNHNRRARKISAGGNLSKGLFDKLFILQRGKCPVCKAALSNVKPRSPLDHIIALANKGENIDSNIQILCQKCNSSKHAKDPIEFMQSRGFLI